MTKPADLPELWTHEPHHHLVYRQGDQVANVDTNATPGFKGNKSDAAELQPERNERFAQLQEMLYANSRGTERQPLAAAGAAGHGYRGQGRHRQTRCGSG